MISVKEVLLCNPKSIIPSLLGNLLGSSRVPPSPIDRPKGQPLTHDQDHHSTQMGLKTLLTLTSPEEALLHHSSQLLQLPTTIITKPYAPLPSPSPSPSHLSRSTSAASTASLSRSSSYLSRSSSLSLDDLIGSDSGVHMSYNEEDTSLTRSNSVCHTCNTRKKSRRVRKCCGKARHYPPPIPSLARTGSLPGRMPWVMTRQYSDGKLILRQERARHQEYMESHREDGRLIMKLVPFEVKDGWRLGDHGRNKGMNNTRYEAIEGVMSCELPHIEEGIERDARNKVVTKAIEAEENESFNLKDHQPSSSPVSFSVCPMTTVP